MIYRLNKCIGCNFFIFSHARDSAFAKNICREKVRHEFHELTRIQFVKIREIRVKKSAFNPWLKMFPLCFAEKTITFPPCAG